MRRAFTTGLALLLTGSLAAPGVLADERVRVETPSSHSPLIGTLVASDDDSISVDTAHSGRVTVPRGQIRRLDVSQGRKSRAGGAAGDRVRIQTESGKARLIGSVEAIDDQEITLDLGASKGRVTVRRDQIRKLDVSRGRGSRIGRGLTAAVIGGGALALATQLSWSDSCSSAAPGLIGYESGDSDACFFRIDRGAFVRAAALVGGTLGFVIGAAVRPGERWETTPPMTFRLSAAPTPGKGVYAQLRVGF